VSNTKVTPRSPAAKVGGSVHRQQVTVVAK
jgi:hypothetical protein